MLSRDLLRSASERIRRAFLDRGQGPATLDQWQTLDAERRSAVAEIDELKRRRNEASREVGARKGKGEAAEELIQCGPPPDQWRGLDRYGRKRAERAEARAASRRGRRP